MQTPYYLVEESLLRKNLEFIKELSNRSGVEFILALKAFALWRLFPIFREYISSTTASSLYEAKLSYEEFGEKCHTYSPAYEAHTFDELLSYSSHITFNSLSQLEFFKSRLNEKVSVGLRINPEYSEIETELYNPTAPGSRFGVLASQLPERLPQEIDGFHLHCHCESNSYALAHTLEHVEAKFGNRLDEVKWLNLGGGHLVTHKDYDTEHFVKVIHDFHAKHPHLQLIAEPGSAFLWQTGDLYASVVDIVENKGIQTAILNVSFTCHMPDCLEMPYFPQVVGGTHYDVALNDEMKASHLYYRLGGNSCLSGDYLGYWKFAQPLQVGDIISLKDMIHYTTVKTTMFNGVAHPAIALKKMDGSEVLLKQWTYEDYKNRMD